MIEVGTINDIPALSAALARRAVDPMIWHPGHDHPRLPPTGVTVVWGSAANSGGAAR